MKAWQPIFAVEGESKDRGVYNAKGLNEFFHPDTFSLPNPLDPIMDKKKKWFAKIDISAFFHHISLSEDFSKYHGFYFDG